LIEHWNGTAWSIVAAPSGSSESQLAKVACPSTTSCLAVGHYATATTGRTLTEQWNGSSWTFVASPNATGAIKSSLEGVSCPGATSCVAVGSSSDQTGATKTLAAQWNGTSWTIIPSPNPAAVVTSDLEAVACATTADCYAVGHSFDGSVNKTLAEHWNGTSWSIVTSPNRNGSGDLHGVSCPSATSCFAVGESSSKTLVEHWNGTSWSLMTTPNPTGTAFDLLNGASCTSPTSCFAVGEWVSGSTGHTLVERWNGTSWSVVSSPNPPLTGAMEAILNSVSCPSSTSCSAVGTNLADTDKTLVERLNGTSWSLMTSPNPTAAINSDLSGVSCPSPTNCDAVGVWSSPASDYTLVERYA